MDFFSEKLCVNPNNVVETRSNNDDKTVPTYTYNLITKSFKRSGDFPQPSNIMNNPQVNSQPENVVDNKPDDTESFYSEDLEFFLADINKYGKDIVIPESAMEKLKEIGCDELFGTSDNFYDFDSPLLSSNPSSYQQKPELENDPELLPPLSPLMSSPELHPMAHKQILEERDVMEQLFENHHDIDITDFLSLSPAKNFLASVNDRLQIDHDLVKWGNGNLFENEDRPDPWIGTKNFSFNEKISASQERRRYSPHKLPSFNGMNSILGYPTPPAEEKELSSFVTLAYGASELFSPLNNGCHGTVDMSPDSDCGDISSYFKQETASPSSSSGAKFKSIINDVLTKRKAEEPEITEVERKRGVLSSYNRQANPKRRKTCKVEKSIKTEIGPFSENWNGDGDVIHHNEHNYSMPLDSDGFRLPPAKPAMTYHRIEIVNKGTKGENKSIGRSKETITMPPPKSKRAVLKPNSNNVQQKQKPKPRATKKNVRSESIRSDHNAKERERRKVLANNYALLHAAAGLADIKCSKNKSLDISAALIKVLEAAENVYTSDICDQKSMISCHKTHLNNNGVKPKLCFTAAHIDSYHRIKEVRQPFLPLMSEENKQVVNKCLESQQAAHLKHSVRYQSGLEIEDILERVNITKKKSNKQLIRRF